MHIPDGFLNAPTAALMFAISIPILAWSWKKAQASYGRSFTAVLAISSAFVFAAQMINFPVAFGTSGHLIGGTFLAVLLGPYAAMMSMTMLLTMQAFIFADGGLTAFGANVFNMAIIGALSFFIIKLMNKNSGNSKKFASSVFIASWLSVVLGALACALEIGVSQVFVNAGGIAVTIPSMLFYHMIIGVGEGAITTVLVLQLRRMQPAILGGLMLLRGKEKQ